ncbi:MAG TPA: efflux RND transporter periplasmic adaptor subunit [Gemmatimonadaceae bacterium]
MNKLKITSAAIALAMLGGTTWFYRRADGSERPAYRTAAIERASLKSTVSATGKLGAVRTVQVGTQVSGQVSELFVDFNDKVKKGQLLARIDPKLQEQAVQDAQAQLERAQAQLAQAEDEYNRNKQLFDAKVITPVEFGATKSTFAVQQAAVKSAEIALDRAKQNLAYTSIFAPIDGVIVERNVDVGQTVAASLSAPQLFLIANDLSEMQILASVDESDIGAIKDGQSVQFTVQSYPNQIFTGSVQQVRLQSTTLDNVVNYTAVINVPNREGRLLPGMTATVQFLTASAENVLVVPNAALRIRPTSDMLGNADTAQKRRPRSAQTDSAGGRDRNDTTAGKQTPRFARSDSQRASSATLWYLDSTGVAHSARVHVGLSDGQKTEVSGPAIREGMQIVTGLPATGETPAAAAPTSNPLSPQRRPGGPGGGRGF